MTVYLRIDECNRGGMIMRRIVSDDSNSLDWYEDGVEMWAEGDIDDLLTTINTFSAAILSGLLTEAAAK